MRETALSPPRPNQQLLAVGPSAVEDPLDVSAVGQYYAGNISWSGVGSPYLVSTAVDELGVQ